MLVTIIRHGKTKGNLEKRYVGITNEPLCQLGIDKLNKINEQKIYNKCEYLYTSPLLRCVQTSDILFNGATHIVSYDLREKDFGEFENKNHNDLKNNKKYIDWCNADSIDDFPAGEPFADFKNRCFNSFINIIKKEKHNNKNNVTIVCHGGTTMAIMSSISNLTNNFYEFYTDNGNGYNFNYDLEKNKATNVNKNF